MKAIFTLTQSMVYFALTDLPKETAGPSEVLLELKSGARRVQLGLPGDGDGKFHDQICGQLPRAQLPEAHNWNWKALEVGCDLQTGKMALVPALVQKVMAPGQQTGHVSGFETAGVLTGWTMAAIGADTELPLRFQVGDVAGFAMTQGTWRKTPHRAFRLHLRPLLDPDRVMPIWVGGALDDAFGFSRGQLFAALTPRGVLQAAPIRQVEDILTGAFHIPALTDAPLRVALQDGGHPPVSGLCNRFSHPNYNFGGNTCGFFLRLPVGFNPATTEVVLTHAGLAAPLRYPLRDFMRSALTPTQQTEALI